MTPCRATTFWARAAGLLLLLAMAGGAAPAWALQVQFEAGSSSINEKVPFAYVRALLDQPAPVGGVRVDYRVTSGTATRDEDYVISDGTLEFTTGSTVTTFRVQIINDRIPEPPEDFYIDLTNPTNGLHLGSLIHNRMTILDNDSKPGKPIVPVVQFLGTQGNASEGLQQGKFGVMLSAAQSKTVRVDYGVDPISTATGGGVDHSLTTGTAVFAPGETYRLVTFPVIDDDLSESDERIRIRLAHPVEATIGSNAIYTFTIQDNDALAVRFGDEGSSGSESVATVDVPLELTRRSTERVTVTLEVTGSARSGEDFTLANNVITFAPGATTAMARINVVDDSLVEDDERLQLALTRSVATPTTPTTRAYTILDNDEKLVDVGFVTRQSDVAEATSQSTVVVRLTEPQDREVRVDYRVAPSSTASAGSDYTLAGGTLRFSSGTLERTITLDIQNDTQDEVDESVLLELLNPVAARLGRIREHKLWITDDDEPVAQVDLFRQKIPTADQDRVLRLIGSLSPLINLRALDVDRAGNIYLTDQGPSRGADEGAILFLPAGSNRTYRILDKLTRPGDIELSNDQRGFVFASTGGELKRHGFGLTIRVNNADPLAGKGEAHIFTDLGEKVVKVSPDGLFHALDLLVDGQTSPTVDVQIRIGGKSKLFESVPLGQTGTEASPYGHRILNLEF